MVSTTSNLNPAVTLYRVACTIMIVLCHTISYYTFVPGHNILPQVFNVGVSAFFFISGYLYGGKQIRFFGTWFKQRILKLWLPLQILVLIDVAILSIFYSQRFSLKTILTYVFNLQGLYFIDGTYLSRFLSGIGNLGPLWFLTCLMICYFLLPILQYSRNKITPPLHIPLCILLFCYLGSFFLEYTTGIVLSYTITFSLGYFISASNYQHYPHRKKISTFLILVCVAFQFGRLLLHAKYDNTPPLPKLHLNKSSRTGIARILVAIRNKLAFPNFYNTNRFVSYYPISESDVVIYLYDPRYFLLRQHKSVYQHEHWDCLSLLSALYFYCISSLKILNRLYLCQVISSKTNQKPITTGVCLAIGHATKEQFPIPFTISAHNIRIQRPVKTLTETAPI